MDWTDFSETGFSTRPLFYILDDNDHPIPVSAPLEWARWKEENWRRCLVGRDEWRQGDGLIRVSTVFLGHDHNFAPWGPPILYETMVFLRPAPPGYEPPQWRYHTAAEAAAGHAAVVAATRREVRPEQGVPLRTRRDDPVVDSARIPRRRQPGADPSTN